MDAHRHRHLHLTDLPGHATAARFEGREHGSSVSFFLSTSRPGGGATPHVHPYDETFDVHAGESTFTVGGERIVCGPGDVVVVPAGTVHGFENTGDGPLLQIGIHASDHVVQRDVDEEDAAAATPARTG